MWCLWYSLRLVAYYLCVCMCPHIIEVKRVYGVHQYIFSCEESTCWACIVNTNRANDHLHQNFWFWFRSDPTDLVVHCHPLLCSRGIAKCPVIMHFRYSTDIPGALPQDLHLLAYHIQYQLVHFVSSATLKWLQSQWIHRCLCSSQLLKMSLGRKRPSHRDRTFIRIKSSGGGDRSSC